jgi:signal transduction histidine kinase
MARGGKLALKPARAAAPPADLKPWRVLVVDDDDQVHDMTRVLLRDFAFEGRPFVQVEARTAAEAAAILAADPDFPVALVDVVMETSQAGLDLVRRIRDELGNRRIRIVLRTGQPGEAPEREVMLAYDVNDYKSKTELTAAKLFTALVGAVRAWRDIVRVTALADELAELNASLERKVIERTEALGRAKTAAELALARETEAKRQLRQFLSMMSHEFRTPLAIIDSAAQMLAMRAEQLDGGESLLPRLGSIRGGVDRLIGLIDTCLADEQLETGSIVLHEEEVDLGDVLAAAVEQHRIAAPGRDIRLEAAPLPPAWGDAGLLALVFANLVGNAVKYSPAGSPVAVAAAEKDGTLCVTVQDRGIGIPAADLPHIFERFHRAGNVGSIGGSGIGLHMAWQIVQLHGGSIEADSGAGGTTFTVRLRRAPAR